MKEWKEHAFLIGFVQEYAMRDAARELEWKRG